MDSILIILLITSAISTTGIKYIAPPSIAAATVLGGWDPLDFTMILAVLFGLVAGAMWRASKMVSSKQTNADIFRDLCSSALAGGANLIAALLIADNINAPPLQALGIAMFVGATGAKTVQSLQQMFLEHLRSKGKGNDNRFS